jgi:hypothetical protein
LATLKGQGVDKVKFTPPVSKEQIHQANVDAAQRTADEKEADWAKAYESVAYALAVEYEKAGEREVDAAIAAENEYDDEHDFDDFDPQAYYAKSVAGFTGSIYCMTGEISEDCFQLPGWVEGGEVDQLLLSSQEEF